MGEGIQKALACSGLGSCIGFGGAFVILVAIFLFVAVTPGATVEPDQSGEGTIPGATKELLVKGKKIIIPATKGKTSPESATSGLAFSCSAEEIKWYMSMRWPYVKWAWNGDTVLYDNTYSLYRGIKVVIYNPKTKKNVVAPICEAGPAPWAGSSWYKKTGDTTKGPPFWHEIFLRFDPPEADGRVSGLAPAAMNAIGANVDDVLEYGFAINQNAEIGKPIN